MFDAAAALLYDPVMDAGAVFVPSGSIIEMAGNSGDHFTLSLKTVSE